MNGPLVKVAFALAVLLMAMSVALFIFPDQVVILGSIAGVVALAVVGVLIYVMIKNRKG